MDEPSEQVEQQIAILQLFIDKAALWLNFESIPQYSACIYDISTDSTIEGVQIK